MRACLFCGGDADEPKHLLKCDGRQGKIDFEDAEKRYPSNALTKTEEEAKAFLERIRRELIAKGREVAHRLCQEQGTVTTKDVRQAMVREGTYQHTTSDCWLGVVFRGDGRFESTGRLMVMTQQDRDPINAETGRASHGGMYVLVWRLKKRETVS